MTIRPPLGRPRKDAPPPEPDTRAQLNVYIDPEIVAEVKAEAYRRGERKWATVEALLREALKVRAAKRLRKEGAK